MARIGTNDATVTPRARYCPRAPPSAASVCSTSSEATRYETGVAPSGSSWRASSLGEAAREQRLLVGIEGHQVAGEQPAHEVQPVAERAPRRPGRARGEARVLDQRAREQREAERRGLLVARAAVAAGRRRRRCATGGLVAAAARMSAPSTSRRMPLIPVEDVARDVCARVIAVVGAVHDPQRVAQPEPVARRRRQGSAP